MERPPGRSWSSRRRLRLLIIGKPGRDLLLCSLIRTGPSRSVERPPTAAIAVFRLDWRSPKLELIGSGRHQPASGGSADGPDCYFLYGPPDS